MRLNHVRALLKNLQRSMNEKPLQVIIPDIPKLCLGAYARLDDCVKLILGKIQNTIASIPGVTLEKVVERAFFRLL